MAIRRRAKAEASVVVEKTLDLITLGQLVFLLVFLQKSLVLGCDGV